MTSAWQSLWVVAEALQPDAGGSRAAARRRAVSDWTRPLRLANDHYLGPALYSALGRAHSLADVPSEVREYLAMLRDLNVDRNAALKAQALELVQALNQAGIEPLLLKGALALFSDIYPDAGVRMLRDIDVLVPAHTAHEAVRALRSLGYEPKTLYEAGHNAIGDFVRTGDPGAVDLHVEVIDSPHLLPARDVWRRATPIAEGVVRFWLPSPLDAVLHNILHAQVHYLGNYYRGVLELRQLYEFASMARRYGASVDWRFCHDHLSKHRLGTPLESYTLAAARLFTLPWPLPRPASAAARIHCGRALFQAAVPAVAVFSVPLANVRAAFAAHRMRALHADHRSLPAQQVEHAVQFIRKKSGRGVIGRLFRAH